MPDKTGGWRTGVCSTKFVDFQISPFLSGFKEPCFSEMTQCRQKLFAQLF